MLPPAHAAISGVISIAVWYYFKSAECAVISFIAGVFIDLDHLIDFYTNHRFTLKVKRIYCVCARMRLKRLYLGLHSYEIVILLWAAIYIFALSNYWKALAIGVTQHIISDQIANPLNNLGYFFTYRILKGFKRERLINELKEPSRG